MPCWNDGCTNAPLAQNAGRKRVAISLSSCIRSADGGTPPSYDTYRRRLLEVLAPFEPVHFTRPDLPLLAENAGSLAKFRLLLVETELGRLDILSKVEPFGSVLDLPTVQLPLLPQRLFEVINLDALIEVKAHVGRGKDKILEEELRAVRAQRKTAMDDE